MYISFIICTYNRADMLRNCIYSILDNNYSKELYEIVVVNNNSTDNTEAVINELKALNKNIRYLIEEQIGLSKARNKGINESKGDIVVFLDDDTILAKEYITHLVEAIHKNSGVVCASGQILPLWGISEPAWFTDAFASIIGKTLYGEDDRILKGSEMPIGANMIFKKTVFGEVGLFNSELGIQGDKLGLGEENDICLRIRKRGYNIHYFSKVLVYHNVHENKVDKNYILDRKKLEGQYLAIIHFNEGSLLKGLASLIKRICILLIRDIPYLLLSIGSNHSFEKKCSYYRSAAYIKTLYKEIFKV